MTKKSKIVENESGQTNMNTHETQIINETISEKQKEEIMSEGTDIFVEDVNNKIQEDLINLGNERPIELNTKIQKEYLIDNPIETVDKQIIVDELTIENEEQAITNNNENAKDLNENSGVTVEEELQKMIVEEKPVRTIASLSKSEYREYQRTGNLPK